MVRRRKRYKRKPWKPIDCDKFTETRLLARLTQQEAARLLYVTERTIRYWENGEVAIPYAAYKLLRILTGYELPGPAWVGWSIRGGTLWSPEGRGFDAAYLGYMWLTFAMARQWQAHLQRNESQGGTPLAGGTLGEEARQATGSEAAAEQAEAPPVLRLVK